MRLKEIYAQFPEQLQYYAYDTTPKNSTGQALMGQAYLMLNVLQNRFLIDRVAIARGLPNQQSLLNTAMEMMDLTTMFWIKRDLLMVYNSSFDWIVSTCSVPQLGRTDTPIVYLLRNPQRGSHLRRTSQASQWPKHSPAVPLRRYTKAHDVHRLLRMDPPNRRQLSARRPPAQDFEENP